MKKKILKFISKCYERPIVRAGMYVLAILIIFWFYGVFSGGQNHVLKRILAIFTSEDTLSVFLAALFSIILAKFFKRCEFYLEESMKIEDNHHKIISIYSGHTKDHVNTNLSDDTGENRNFYNKSGVFIQIRQDKERVTHRPKNTVPDRYSKKYQDVQEDIENFENGHLYLPSLNVFTNVRGDTDIVFEDSSELFHLPDFVMQNARKLLEAHRNSKRTNNGTVRLRDLDYSQGKLTLNTQRSMYFHMLITNRCMDYQFDEGLSIRTVYEYNEQISPLDESMLGNQIGINGLILSSDGYVLIEKRDHTKTTWKNKFAQPISLALKLPDLGLQGKDTLGSTPEEANAKMKKLIEKTVASNFGLRPDEYEQFSIRTNFLGVARDLLEGGKPNLYFFLTTKMTAAELAVRLEENAALDRAQDGRKPLKTEKLDSDYYLVPYSDMWVDFNYNMQIDRSRKSKNYWICRKSYPRVSRWEHNLDRLRHGWERFFDPVIQRECGEALLVTMAYLEICRDRIAAIGPEKGGNEHG